MGHNPYTTLSPLSHTAGVFGVSQSTVARMQVRFRTYRNVIQALRQRFVTATALQNDLQNATGVRISRQTITELALLLVFFLGHLFIIVRQCYHNLTLVTTRPIPYLLQT